jgi:hypothetical protein
MTDLPTDSQLREFWVREFADTGHCCLCGNHGVIDTRRQVFTPAGVECGDTAFCICPNGRAMKKGSGRDKPSEETLARRQYRPQASIDFASKS